MLILRLFVAAFLALSGISDAGKFLEEIPKTFKMFEKSDSSDTSDQKEVQKNESKSESKKSSSESLNSAEVPENVDTVSVKKVSLSEKAGEVSKQYNKTVSNYLGGPLQLQKLCVTGAKPIAEWASSGLVVYGDKPEGTLFNWLDVLSGKPNKKLLNLGEPSQ